MRPLFVALCIALLNTFCFAGMVVTVDGERLSGDVRLEGESVEVRSTSGPTAKIPLARIDRVRFTVDPFPISTEPGVGALKAEYFRGTTFDPSQRVLLRSEPGIEGRWDGPANHPFSKSEKWERFSVRWTGQIQPRYSEKYKFDLGPQSMARLWIDQRLVVDSQADLANPVMLEAGRKYDLRVETVAKPRPFQMMWECPSQPKQVVPAECFFVRQDDAEAPAVVRVTAPTDQAILQEGKSLPITVRFDAGVRQIDRLELIAGGALLKSVSRPPYQFDWPMVSAGHQTLVAKAIDKTGEEWTSKPLSINVGSNHSASIPAPWMHAPIGPPSTQPAPKAPAMNEHSATLHCARGELYSESDKCEFLFRPLEGDGEIIARIADVQPAGESEWNRPLAGVMIRKSLAPGSAGASLVFSPGWGFVFVARKRDNFAPDSATAAEKEPGYVKLVRQGNRIRGFRSDDGKKWVLAGEVEVDLPETILIGTAISSQSEASPAKATFDQLRVAARESTLLARTHSFGLQLIDGTRIRTRFRLVEKDESLQADFDLGGGELPRARVSLPASAIARVYFHRLAPEADELIDPHQTGVIFANGDFLEGPVTLLDSDSASIQSELLGIREFNSKEGLAVAVVRPIVPAVAGFVVTLKNGSQLFVDKLSIENSSLAVESSVLGRLVLPQSLLISWKKAR